MANITRKAKHCGRKPITGISSKRVKSIIEKLNADPLKLPDDIEFKNYVEEMKARSAFYDIKSKIQQLITEQIISDGQESLSYKADIIKTESEITKLEKKIQFHEIVVNELRKEYRDTKNKDLLEEIDKREKSLKEYDSMLMNWFDLRNKLRNSLARQQKKDSKENSELLNEDIQDAVWEKLENE